MCYLLLLLEEVDEGLPERGGEAAREQRALIQARDAVCASLLLRLQRDVAHPRLQHFGCRSRADLLFLDLALDHPFLCCADGGFGSLDALRLCLPLLVCLQDGVELASWDAELRKRRLEECSGMGKAWCRDGGTGEVWCEEGVYGAPGQGKLRGCDPFGQRWRTRQPCAAPHVRARASPASGAPPTAGVLCRSRSPSWPAICNGCTSHHKARHTTKHLTDTRLAALNTPRDNVSRLAQQLFFLLASCITRCVALLLMSNICEPQTGCAVIRKSPLIQRRNTLLVIVCDGKTQFIADPLQPELCEGTDEFASFAETTHGM